MHRTALSLPRAQPPKDTPLPNKEHPIVIKGELTKKTIKKVNSPKRREEAGRISLGVEANDVAEMEEARRAQDFTHLDGRRASGQQKRLLDVNVDR